jgi:hypothetical protein
MRRCMLLSSVLVPAAANWAINFSCVRHFRTLSGINWRNALRSCMFNRA